MSKPRAVLSQRCISQTQQCVQILTLTTALKISSKQLKVNRNVLISSIENSLHRLIIKIKFPKLTIQIMILLLLLFKL